MLRRAARLLEGAGSVALVIHQLPDGDAIGSASALAQTLVKLGKRVTIFCASPVPELFTTIVGPLVTVDALPTADLYVLLDCAELHRPGCGRQLQHQSRQGGSIMAVDHHASGDWPSVTEHCFINPKASSTAEIVFELLSFLRAPLTAEVATALLLGVYTDTGGFTHANTTDACLKLAGRLSYYGADLHLITRTLSHRDQSAPKARLWGCVMSELTITKLGIVIARVRQDQFDDTKTTLEDVSGLANALALVEEARAALVLIETGGGYRGILRTRHHNINLGRLARLLGGAGRPTAAGFTATK